ncbi:MAG: enoyl-CoA hydratase/isomerase family protein [Pseudomonadota bacterium]
MSESPVLLNKKTPEQWLVTINRIDKANALTRDMRLQLRDVFFQAQNDTELRSLVITGAGDRVFSGGADLAEVRANNEPRDDVWDEMSQALVDVPALTVAMINGHCIGGGMVLALCCDFRIGAQHAQFAYPALRMGAIPGNIDRDRLNHFVGTARASLLLLGDARIDALEACQWGLIERVVDQNDLYSAVDNLCESANSSDGAHLAALKRRIWSCD